jgi:hypothetical protein
MAIQVVSGASADQWTIDPTSKAGRVTLYDASGNPISNMDQSALIPGVDSGLQLSGADYKISRLLACSSSGHLRAADEMLFLYDSIEGATAPGNKWISTLTTMTVAQAAGARTYNSGSSVATTVGAMYTSQRRFPIVQRAALVYRNRSAATTHFNNNLIEFGFGSPASATAASIGDGAIWRKDGTGQWIPVVSINGSEVLGTAISNGTFIASIPPGRYAVFEVRVEASRARFSIYTSAGALLNEQTLDYGDTVADFNVTHLQAMERTYNSAATGTAVQFLVAASVVVSEDALLATRPYPHIQAASGYDISVSPTAFTQLANYANSAAPASATLSNTAAGYTTLGGQWQFAAVAGAETDYALFGFTNPSPYTLFITGVQIAAFNTGAAVATTPTLLQWALAVNSSAVSLATGAPYSPMKVTLGSQSFAVGAAIGQDVPGIVRTFGTPLAVQPGRFLHLILKMPVATATASQVVRGTASFDGYFE